MMKLTKEEQHRQCIKEIKATLLVVFWLLKFVFVDFQYEEDESEGENEQ